MISFELVRGLTAVVYCRHTGGKASSPHKWGKAGYADHLGRLSVTRANRRACKLTVCTPANGYGLDTRHGTVYWLAGCAACGLQASGWSCRGWSVGLVCVCALYSSTKLDFTVVATYVRASFKCIIRGKTRYTHSLQRYKTLEQNDHTREAAHTHSPPCGPCELL